MGENWAASTGESGGESGGDSGGDKWDIPIRVDVGEAATEWQYMQQWLTFLWCCFFSTGEFTGDEAVS